MCHRELLNLMVRVRAKLEARDVFDLRREVAEQAGKNITFMSLHDEQIKKIEDHVSKMESEARQMGDINRFGDGKDGQEEANDEDEEENFDD